MADLRVPWAPMDYSGLGAIADQITKNREEARAEENARTQRDFAERNFRAQDNKSYREDRAWNDMLEQRKKLEHDQKIAAIPDLIKATRNYARLMGPEAAAEMANAQENPYVHFGAQSHTAAPLMAGEEGPLEAWQPGRAILPPALNPNAAPAAPPPQEVGPPVQDVQPTEQVPEPYTPLHGTGVTVPEPPPQAPPVPPEAMAAAAPPEPPPQTPGQFHTAEGQGFDAPTTHMLMAQFLGKGKQYEIPSASQTLGLGGKADEEYNALISSGRSEDEAAKAAIATHLKELSDTERDQRLADAISGRATAAEEQHKFTSGENAKYKDTPAQRDARARILARARQAAAGGGPLTPEEAALVAKAIAGEDIGEVSSEAAAAGKKADVKHWGPLVQHAVTNAAAGERAGQKREQLVATDENGNNMGTWKSPAIATKGTQIVQRFHRVEERLQELIKDVEENGERIPLNSSAYINRRSKAKAAAAALRPYNELSSTDASMKSEEAILGPTGAFGDGWVLGADLPTLHRLLDEARAQQKVNLNTMLRPNGGSQLAPALGGPKGGPAAKAKSPLDALEEYANSLGGK